MHRLWYPFLLVMVTLGLLAPSVPWASSTGEAQTRIGRLDVVVVLCTWGIGFQSPGFHWGSERVGCEDASDSTLAAGGVERLAARFDPARAGHIFHEAAGHVNPASAGSQARFARLFEEVVSNPANLRADAVQASLITQHADDAGVLVDRENRAGLGHIRNGLIQNAGANLPGAFR